MVKVCNILARLTTYSLSRDFLLIKVFIYSLISLFKNGSDELTIFYLLYAIEKIFTISTVSFIDILQFSIISSALRSLQV